MKDFYYSAEEWRKLSRTDKKILHYFRQMEIFYQDMAIERTKQNQDIKRNAPATKPMRGIRPRGR
jgi:hypothetical protein